MSVFAAPPRGVGADTGAQPIIMPGSAGDEGGPLPPTMRQILFYESGTNEGRREGPLLLTVRTDTTQLVFGAPQPQVQSVPLPSVNRGWSATQLERAESEWGDFGGNRPFVGSLIITIQVGAVGKTVVADLISGTYQLPACDSVKVSVALRRIDYTDPDGDKPVWVEAAVTPGRSNAAQDLLYSSVALWRAPEGENFIKHSWPVPEGSTSFRMTMLTYGDADLPDPPYPVMSMLVGSGTYEGPTTWTLITGEWIKVLAAQTRVQGTFLVSDGPEGGWEMIVGGIWRVDL